MDIVQGQGRKLHPLACEFTEAFEVLDQQLAAAEKDTVIFQKGKTHRVHGHGIRAHTLQPGQFRQPEGCFRSQHREAVIIGIAAPILLPAGMQQQKLRIADLFL